MPGGHSRDRTVDIEADPAVSIGTIRTGQGKCQTLKWRADTCETMRFSRRRPAHLRRGRRVFSGISARRCRRAGKGDAEPGECQNV